MLVLTFVISFIANNLFAQGTIDVWKGNCKVVYNYSHELQFSVLLIKPGGTGTNKKALLNLLGKFKFDNVPELKKKLVTIIAMINKAQPFKTSYGDADIIISNDLSKKINELFADVKKKAKEKGVDCGN